MKLYKKKRKLTEHDREKLKIRLNQLTNKICMYLYQGSYNNDIMMHLPPQKYAVYQKYRSMRDNADFDCQDYNRIEKYLHRLQVLAILYKYNDNVYDHCVNLPQAEYKEYKAIYKIIGNTEQTNMQVDIQAFIVDDD